MKKFSLVRWTEGSDKGKYTCLETVCVRGLEIEEAEKCYQKTKDYTFTDIIDKEGSIYMVEWRVGGKKPQFGWPCYEAELIMLSEKRSGLEKMIIEISEYSTQNQETNNSDLEDDPALPGTSSKADVMKNTQKTFQKRMLEKYSSKTEKSQDSDVSHNKKGHKSDSTGLSNPVDITALQKELDQLKKDYFKTKEENRSLKKLLYNEIPNLVTKCDKALGTMAQPMTPTASAVRTMVLPVTPTTPPAADVPVAATSAESTSRFPVQSPTGGDMVELVPGSGVLVKSLSFKAAQSSKTYSIYTRSLLKCVFPESVLLVSSLRGGIKKNSADGGDEKRQALDQEKVDAIYEAVRIKFGNVEKTMIGLAINGKLNELRKGKSSV